MTIVRCGTCDRPGLMCECDVATAHGTLFGIPAGGFEKWDPQRMSEAPLTLQRIYEAFDRWRQPRPEPK